MSQVINGRSPNHRALIKACAPNRILAESDYNDIDMSMSQTWKIILTIAEEKQWEVEEEWLEDVPDESKWGVVRRLEENWRLFRAGNYTQALSKREGRKLKEDQEGETDGIEDIS